MARFRILIVLLISWSAAAFCFADETMFRDVAPHLQAFRAGTEDEISIRFTATSFRVMRRTEGRINADEARPLIKTDSLPIFKIAQDANWLEHTVSQDLAIEEPITEGGESDGTRAWKKLTWEEVQTFDRSVWPRFLEFAIANGLSSIEQSRYEGKSSLTLSFAPITPAHIVAGPHTLVLNNKFASSMRLSPKYPPRTGNRGFVILLHDPHENVAGRFQTLTGLRQLISSNQQIKFRFLVEGAYWGPTRNIGFSGLDLALPPGATTNAAIVHRLLANYVINTPMAYRLLYDREIGTLAIDNNELLTYPAPRATRSFEEQLMSIAKISAALDKAKLPDEASKAKTTLDELLTMAFVYLTADLEEAPDTTLIDHYQTLASLYEAIAQIGTNFTKAGFQLSPPDLKALATDSLGCKDEAAIYKKARDRNKTMAPLIIDATLSAPVQIPIAFIGNYHTEGIIAELVKASIGYVVIEPRPRVVSSRAEHEAFERANHGNTRKAYLSTVLFNMGYNSPSAPEVREVIAPRIKNRVPELRAQRLAGQRDFKSLPDNAVDIGQLTVAADGNGSLATATIVAGGSLPPPPGDFGKAFAYFDPDSGGRGPRLVVTNPTDRRWTSNDRYGFISAALFKAPRSSSRETVQSRAEFYPDPESGRLFFTAYDAKSRRVYCFEGQPQEAASLVAIPLGSDKDEQNARTQIVELLKASENSWLIKISTQPGE